MYKPSNDGCVSTSNENKVCSMVSPYEEWSVGAPTAPSSPDRSAAFNMSPEENIYKREKFRKPIVLLILLVNWTCLSSTLDCFCFADSMSQKHMWYLERLAVTRSTWETMSESFDYS